MTKKEIKSHISLQLIEIGEIMSGLVNSCYGMNERMAKAMKTEYKGLLKKVLL